MTQARRGLARVMALPYGRLAGWAYAYVIPGKGLPLSFFLLWLRRSIRRDGYEKSKGVQTNDGDIRVYHSQQILVVHGFETNMDSGAGGGSCPPSEFPRRRARESKLGISRSGSLVSREYERRRECDNEMDRLAWCFRVPRHG